MIERVILRFNVDVAVREDARSRYKSDALALFHNATRGISSAEVYGRSECDVARRKTLHFDLCG